MNQLFFFSPFLTIDFEVVLVRQTSFNFSAKGTLVPPTLYFPSPQIPMCRVLACFIWLRRIRVPRMHNSLKLISGRALTTLLSLSLTLSGGRERESSILSDSTFLLGTERACMLFFSFGSTCQHRNLYSFKKACSTLSAKLEVQKSNVSTM